MTYDSRGQLPDRVVVPDVQVSYLDTCGTCNICDFSGYDKCPLRKQEDVFCYPLRKHVEQEREVKRSASNKARLYLAK